MVADRRRQKCRRLLTELLGLCGRFQILVGLDILTLGAGFDRPPGRWAEMRAISRRADRIRATLRSRYAQELSECARMDTVAESWPTAWPLCHIPEAAHCVGG